MSGTEKNKLNQEDVSKIITDLKNGVSKNSLAKKYNIDRTTIYYYIKKGGIKIQNQKLKPTIKFIRQKINGGKNYAKYLKIENEKRKERNWYLLKTQNPHFSPRNKKADKPLSCPAQIAGSPNDPETEKIVV